MLKRMLGLSQTPAVPRNDLHVWSEDKRRGNSEAALQARDAKFQQREEQVTLLRTARDLIVQTDSACEIGGLAESETGIDAGAPH